MTHARAVCTFIVAVFVAAAAACASDAVAPPTVTESGRSERLSRMRAELVSTIQGMELFLTADGFDRMIRSGRDANMIGDQRRVLEQQLAGARVALRKLDAGNPTALFDYIVPPEGSDTIPPVCMVNGNLDGCFVGTPTSSTPTNGQGSVFQMVGTPDFSHTTVTSLALSGVGTYVAPRVTDGDLFNKLVHSKPIYYPALTCLTTQHLQSNTVHQLGAGAGAGWFHLSLGGKRFSSDTAGCTGLTLTAARTTLGRNDYTDVTVEIPANANCSGLTVVSSNPAVASVSNLQGNIWGVYSGSTGSVTITARCANGSAGTVSIYVTYQDDPDDAEVSSTGGEMEWDDTRLKSCGYFVWKDVFTGEWLSAPFYLCEGDTPPPCSCTLWQSKGSARRMVLADSQPLGGEQSQERAASAMAARGGSGKRASASILLVGVSELNGRARATVQVDPTGKEDAIIVVDLTRATPEDVEAAIAGVSHLLNSSDAPPAAGELGVVPQKLGGNMKDRAMTRSRVVLGRLKAAPESERADGRPGRVMKVQVDLQTVRKYTGG